jgi:hypothetical protein
MIRPCPGARLAHLAALYLLPSRAHSRAEEYYTSVLFPTPGSLYNKFTYSIDNKFKVSLYTEKDLYVGVV